MDILQGRDRSLGQTNTCQPSQVIAPSTCCIMSGVILGRFHIYLFLRHVCTVSDRRGHHLPPDLINEDSWFSFLMRTIASKLQSSNIFTGVNFLTGLNEGFHVLLNFL